MARVMPSTAVSLPTRTAMLDGSHSTDDKGGLSYLWARDENSPAAGVRLEKPTADENKKKYYVT